MVAVCAFGCAQAMNDESQLGDTADESADAGAGFPDARPAADASTLPPADAAAVSMADAAPGGICEDNNGCTQSGTCCLIAICVSGTAIGDDICIPQ